MRFPRYRANKATKLLADKYFQEQVARLGPIVKEECDAHSSPQVPQSRSPRRAKAPAKGKAVRQGVPPQAA